jgi:hypothetical protein
MSNVYDLETLYAQATQQLTPERPLIAITGNFGDKGCELAEGYYQSILRAGATPLVVPPTSDLTAIDALLHRVDGILLSGGADLNPLWVGEEPHSALGGINPLRDAFELLLIRRAADHQIPMLGICRGMQILAAALGGKLEQDMTSARPDVALLKHSQNAPRAEATHRVQLLEDSLLGQLLGREIFVNSFHHQAVADTGTQFRAVGFASDGTIEAMESTTFKSILGVQWHPECMDNEDSARLFRHFVQQCASYHRARQWHQHHLSLDSHCDTPMFFDQDIDFNRRDPKILVDAFKMAEGGLDASIMVAYLAQKERTPEAHLAATAKADGILDRLTAMVEHCPSVRMAFSPEEVRANKAAGYRSILPGIENGYAFGTDLANVAHYRQRGIVYTTLCHNGNNEICDSARPNALDKERFPATNGAEHGGLSAFGREVVAEMNRVGMMVDLSHAAESTFYDALAVSKVPIVCSHSSSKVLCNHPRNLTDDQLRALAATGGVAQCTFYCGFLRTDEENATLDDAVAHMLHMIKVAGVDHIGIGTDFDGDGGVPGLASASELINLTRRLQAEGFTDHDLEKLWGGNFLRVMTQAQAAAQA